MQKLSYLFLTSLLFSIIIMSTTWAAKRPGIHPLLSDDFTAGLGWYYANTESNIGAEGKNGIGDNISLENDLNFDDNNSVFLGGFKWRFTKSFHVSYEYLNINRDASATLNKDISWDDFDFAAGANIKSEFTVDVHRLFVGYSFIQSKKLELGAGFGLHLMNLEVGLAGRATINGTSVANGGSKKDGLAPLPNIGFYGAYAFSPKIIVTGRADWFSADISDYKGSLTSISADVQYQAFKHVGFGAGYHYLNVDVEAHKDNWNGHADFSYNGPKLFMSINF